MQTNDLLLVFCKECDRPRQFALKLFTNPNICLHFSGALKCTHFHFGNFFSGQKVRLVGEDDTSCVNQKIATIWQLFCVSIEAGTDNQMKEINSSNCSLCQESRSIDLPVSAPKRLEPWCTSWAVCFFKTKMFPSVYRLLSVSSSDRPERDRQLTNFEIEERNRCCSGLRGLCLCWSTRTT